MPEIKWPQNPSDLKESQALQDFAKDIASKINFRKWHETNTPGIGISENSNILSAFLSCSCENPYASTHDVMEKTLQRVRILPADPLRTWMESGEYTPDSLLFMICYDFGEADNADARKAWEDNAEEIKKIIQDAVISEISKADTSQPWDIFSKDARASLVCIPGKPREHAPSDFPQDMTIKTDGEQKFIPNEQLCRTMTALGLDPAFCPRLSELFPKPQSSETAANKRVRPVLDMETFCNFADDFYDSELLFVLYTLIPAKEMIALHAALSATPNQDITLTHPIAGMMSTTQKRLSSAEIPKENLPLALSTQNTLFLSGADLKYDPASITGLDDDQIVSHLSTEASNVFQ